MRRAPHSTVLTALLLVAAVWTLLLLAALARPVLGEGATLLGVGLGLTLVASTRPAPAGRAGLSSTRAGLSSALLAGAAGFASLPAWLCALAPAGSALGLEVRLRQPPAPSALRAACDLLLGPALEELLYRERLLPPLRAALGAPAAVVLSSLLFALPHRDPWLVLAAFGLGLVLGVGFLASRAVAPCIAAHAGVNLAALAWLRAEGSLPLSPSASLRIALPLFILALLCARTLPGRR
jgi:hypothetical protein